MCLLICLRQSIKSSWLVLRTLYERRMSLLHVDKDDVHLITLSLKLKTTVKGYRVYKFRILVHVVDDSRVLNSDHMRSDRVEAVGHVCAKLQSHVIQLHHLLHLRCETFLHV
jgi:hypothetical protein